MKEFLVFAFIVVIAIAFAGEVTAKELNIAGSTIVEERVLEPAKDGIKRATGFDVKVRGIGSGKGFSELVDGKIEASIASSSLGSLLKKAGLSDDGTYQEHKILDDVIVPIVHPSNPVTELTWEQLSDINTGKVTNWKEVGGPDRKILVVTSPTTAATRSVFQKKVRNREPYKKDVLEAKSTRQEVDLVGKFKGSIGAVSRAVVRMSHGKVKVIKTQKISRPLSIITKGEPSADMQTIIDYLRTPDAQKLYK